MLTKKFLSILQLNRVLPPVLLPHDERQFGLFSKSRSTAMSFGELSGQIENMLLKNTLAGLLTLDFVMDNCGRFYSTK